MKKYAAIIIDLKKSRSYKQGEREEIQNYMKDVIIFLNKVFKKSIELDVVFSAGDEIQGLFCTPEAAYLYFRWFYMLIFPVGIRTGIGVGEWNIKMKNSDYSTEQDGLVYHNARYAIDSIDDVSDQQALVYSGKKGDIYINAAIYGEVSLVAKRSFQQNELSILVEKLYPLGMTNICDFQELCKLSKVLKQKGRLTYYKKKQQIGDSISENLEESIEGFIEVQYVDQFSQVDHVYVNSGRIKGLAYRLSEKLNKSRQNMDKTIKSAGIFPARNGAIVVLKLMGEYLNQEGRE